MIDLKRRKHRWFPKSPQGWLLFVICWVILVTPFVYVAVSELLARDYVPFGEGATVAVGEAIVMLVALAALLLVRLALAYLVSLWMRCGTYRWKVIAVLMVVAALLITPEQGSRGSYFHFSEVISTWRPILFTPHIDGPLWFVQIVIAIGASVYFWQKPGDVVEGGHSE